MISMEKKCKKIRTYQLDIDAGYDVKRFGDDCLEMTLEDLFAGNYETDGVCERYEMPYVLMDGFEKEEIYNLLSSAVDPVIPVVLTEHNRSWKVRDLMDEAFREHKWFIVNDLMKELNEKDLSSLDITDKNTIMNAWMALQKEEDVSGYEIPLQEILKKV